MIIIAKMNTLDDMDLLGDVDLIGDVSSAFDDGDDGVPSRAAMVRYSRPLMRKILRQVEKGVPIRVVLRAEGMPHYKTFYAWLDQHGHRDEYEAAKVRPVHVDEDVANEVIYRIAKGETFKQIHDSDPENLPDRMRFKDWMKSHPELSIKYHTALALRAEGSIDEAEAIADESLDDWTTDRHGNPVINTEAIQRSKLRIEIRKWTAGKYNARFQERNTTELVGPGDSPLIPQTNDQDIARRVAFLLASGLVAQQA